jgi:hypothetical protein
VGTTVKGVKPVKTLSLLTPEPLSLCPTTERWFVRRPRVSCPTAHYGAANQSAYGITKGAMFASLSLLIVFTGE